MKWFFMNDKETSFYPHILSEALKKDVEISLKKRFEKKGENIKFDFEPVKKASLDLPGMVMLDREWTDIDINGFILAIPTSDISYTLYHSQQTEVRKEIGQDYFKLKFFFMRYLCLTPKEKEIFEKQLINELPKALAIEEAENKMFDDRLKNIQKKVNIVSAKRSKNKNDIEA